MAGGQWRLQVPSSYATTVGVGAYTPGQAIVVAPTVEGWSTTNKGFAEPGNLLQQDAPTVLTAWALESIYLPFLVSLAYFTAPPTVPNVVVTARLSVNGQLVWSQAVPVAAIDNGAQGYYSNGVFSDNFPNPIALTRGAALKLDAVVTADQPDASHINASVGFALAFGTGGAKQPYEGAIGYAVTQLAGARRL